MYAVAIVASCRENFNALTHCDCISAASLEEAQNLFEMKELEKLDNSDDLFRGSLELNEQENQEIEELKKENTELKERLKGTNPVSEDELETEEKKDMTEAERPQARGGL